MCSVVCIIFLLCISRMWLLVSVLFIVSITPVSRGYSASIEKYDGYYNLGSMSGPVQNPYSAGHL